jgi:hypothetical protein
MGKERLEQLETRIDTLELIVQALKEEYDERQAAKYEQAAETASPDECVRTRGGAAALSEDPSP